MIVTADPLGDFNATSQILRYSALAREITVPRTPSIPSTVLSGMYAKGENVSGRTTPMSYPSEELEYAAQEIARLSEELDVMTFRMADEEKRRIEAEDAWKAADERCLLVEQQVREECSAEMERTIETEMRRWKGAWGEEADRNDEHLDKKLGILTQTIQSTILFFITVTKEDKSNDRQSTKMFTSHQPTTLERSKMRMQRYGGECANSSTSSKAGRRPENQSLAQALSVCEPP